MAKQKIQETGAMDYRDLQYENLSDAQKYIVDREREERRNLYHQKSLYNFKEQSKIYDDSPYLNVDKDYQNKSWYQSNDNDFYGNSFWDDESNPYYGDEEELAEERANNQWTSAKLAAGSLKMLGTAGSSFLNGTAGLLFGLGEMVANTEDRHSLLGRFSYSYNNLVTDALADFNNSMETWLPNYETQEEKEGSWLQNLDSMNFWANHILKNLGFTAGTAASMYLTGGLGAAFKFGSFGTRAACTLFGAVNESMFEANNTLRDWKKTQYEKAAQANGIDVDTLLNDEDYSAVKDGIDETGWKVGLIDMAMNSVILTVSDWMFLGKIVSKGWSGAIKDASKKEANKFLQREAGVFGKYFTKEGLSPTKEAWKETGKTMTSEGLEEMFQSFSAKFSGGLYDKDDYNTFYNTDRNKKFESDATNFTKTAINSFANTFLDLNNWEEFFAGAITSLAGAPTFGSSNNQQTQTWLGKGKKIGLSGGFFGNLAEAKEQVGEAQDAERILNSLNKKFSDANRFFANTMSYSDKLNRFRNDDDKFEYKNNEDNLDFEAINYYNKYNRLEDLVTIANQSFDNLSERDLCNIVGSSSNIDPKTGKIVGWKDKAGNSLITTDGDGNPHMSAENQEYVKNELNKKKELTLKKIQDYKEALNIVDNMKGFNPSDLSDFQREELAWLMWKQVQFSDRLKSMVKDNASAFGNVTKALSGIKEELEEKKSKINPENKEETNKIDKQLSLVDGYISNIEDLKENKFTKFLAANTIKDFYKDSSLVEKLEKGSTDYENFSNNMKDIVDDITKLASIKNSFADRTKFYIDNAQKIAEDRKKKEKKAEEVKQKVEESAANVETVERIKSAPITQITKLWKDSKEDFDRFEKLSESDEEAKKKFEVAKSIVKKYNDVLSAINQLKAETKDSAKIDYYNKLIEVLNRSFEAAENPESLFTQDDASSVINDIIDSADEVPQEEIENIESTIKAYMDTVAERMGETADAVEDIPNDVLNNPSDTVDPNQFNVDDSDDTVDKNQASGEEEEEEDKKEETQPENKEAVGYDGPTPKESLNEKERRKQREKQNKEEQDKLKNKFNEAKKIVSQFIDATSISFDKKTKNSLVSYFASRFRTEVPVSQDYHKAIESELNNGKLSWEKEARKVIKAQDVYDNLYDYFCNCEAYYMKKIEATNEAPVDNSQPGKATDIAVSSEEINEEDKELVFKGDTTVSNENKDLQQPENETKDNDAKSIDKKVEWFPNIREVNSGWDGKGNLVPWSGIKKDNDSDDVKEKKRIETAILEYLHANHAFENAFKIKEDAEVKFLTDATLNKNVGHVVILMSDEDGNIIGSLPICVKGVHTFTDDQKEFYESFVDKYNSWQEKNITDAIFESNIQSSVKRKLIGKVWYADDIQTIQEQLDEDYKKSGITNADVHLAIYNGDDFYSSIPSSSIQKPLSGMKSGQPVVLIPTGVNEKGRKYIARAVITPPFSNEETSKKFKSALSEQIDKLKKLPVDSKSIMDWIRVFKCYMAFDEVHVNFENGDLVVKANLYDDPRQIELYRGDQDALDVEDFLSNLNGAPIQVSKNFLTNPQKAKEYTNMMFDVCKTNLNQLFPVNSWFTINAIDKNKPVESENKKTKTLGYNPNATLSNQISFNISYKGKAISIKFEKDESQTSLIGYVFNPSDKEWKPIKEELFQGRDKKVYETSKAEAEIELFKKLGEDGIYDTSLGKFDKEKKEFVDDKEAEELMFSFEGTLSKEVGSKGEKSSTDTANVVTEDKTENKESPKNANVEEGSTNKNNASPSRTKEEKTFELIRELQDPLLEEYKDKFSKFDLVKQKEIANEIKNNNLKTRRGVNKKALDSYLELLKGGNTNTNSESSSDFRIVTPENENENKIDLNKEVSWLQKVLPQFNNDECLKIVNRLIETSKQGLYAYGKFSDGVITIYNKAAEGTLFHEAFHAISRTLLDESERNKMYNEAAKVYGEKSDLELEEKLAEAFRRYVEIQEKPASNIIERLFKWLKDCINRFIGKEAYLNGLFYRINRGEYANRKSNRTPSSKLDVFKQKERSASYNLMMRNDVKNAIEEQYSSYNTDNIIRYYSQKLLYQNLSEEQKNHLEKRGVSESTYNEMSDLEKEALFECN